MHLLPAQEDVVRILRETGALRIGHFQFPNGSHSDEFLQIPLAMRHYQHAKVLSVGLSRLLRADSEIRAMIPELSIIAPATGGLPVAYGVCEALQAKQVYWAERQEPGKPFRFPHYLEPQPREQVVLVDDLLHSGAKLADLKTTIESYGATVIAVAVLVYQPTPLAHEFESFHYLARLEESYYADAASCALCKKGMKVTETWI